MLQDGRKGTLAARGGPRRASRRGCDRGRRTASRLGRIHQGRFDPGSTFMSVRVTSHFGIVVQKSALNRRGLDRAAILALMEAAQPFDEDAALLSFGPHFGEEAANEFLDRL